MPKRNKILLSAYACEPNKGSEPGIGWNWAITLNELGYNVTVVTRANNKVNIDKIVSENKKLETIQFEYYDLPSFLFKRKKMMGVHLYYELWQKGLLNYVKNNINPDNYDIVHHITFGVFRQPSRLHELNKPFVFGPLGGGETIPKLLLAGLPYKYRCIEFIRTTLNKLSLKRLSLKNCLNHADIIFTRTNETKSYIPNKFIEKTKVKIDIGLFPDEISKEIKKLETEKVKTILYVGRLTYWKGLELAIRSFHLFNKQHPNSIFTIIGSGKYRQEMENLTHELEIANKVNFVGQIPQLELFDHYKNATAFLFPSLHDAGPLVTLEALRVGLPIVTLNIGGLGQILKANYPTIVNSQNFDKEETISSLSQFLLKLSTEKDFYAKCSGRSLSIANENTWAKTVASVYTDITEVLNA